MTKSRLRAAAALCLFGVFAVPASGFATTWGNAQVSWQTDNPGCFTSAYGTVTCSNTSCTEGGTVYLWPTTQAHNGYYNVVVQVYNSQASNPVGCGVVGTNMNGTQYWNEWQYASYDTGYQSISMTETNDVFIGTAAMYLECSVPQGSSILAWGID